MTGDFLKVMLNAKEVRDREFPYCPWVVHMKGQRVKSFDHGWTALTCLAASSGQSSHDRNSSRAGLSYEPPTDNMETHGLGLLSRLTSPSRNRLSCIDRVTYWFWSAFAPAEYSATPCQC